MRYPGFCFVVAAAAAAATATATVMAAVTAMSTMKMMCILAAGKEL